MKIQLGQWTIRTASSLKRKLNTDWASKRDDNTYWRLVGIYDTRMFGLVFYRNERPEKHGFESWQSIDND